MSSSVGSAGGARAPRGRGGGALLAARGGGEEGAEGEVLGEPWDAAAVLEDERDGVGLEEGLLGGGGAGVAGEAGEQGEGAGRGERGVDDEMRGRIEVAGETAEDGGLAAAGLG